VKIAIIAPPWLPVPPCGYGGTEEVIDGLARGLASEGHDVLLFTTEDSTCPVERASVLDHALGTDGGGAWEVVRHVMHAYAAARDYDVVHDHTLIGPLYGEQVTDAPVVTTNHGPFEPDIIRHYRVVARHAWIVSISRHHASTAGCLPIAAVIHHGLEVDTFPLGGPTTSGAVFLGRMAPEKGVHAAIHTARAAGLPLRIAAKMREPREHEYFEQQVRPLLGGDVEYLGEVSAADKPHLLAGATCLLNPIQWPEPFGMVAIEALACGTPVVATPCGAMPELVDEGVTGFLRADVDGMVRALHDVGSLDRVACRRTVEERFSIRRMTRDHVVLYERLCESRC
jgi:glycosyltransferase involved in cell wall biosynthesis